MRHTTKPLAVYAIIFIFISTTIDLYRRVSVYQSNNQQCLPMNRRTTNYLTSKFFSLILRSIWYPQQSTHSWDMLLENTSPYKSGVKSISPIVKRRVKDTKDFVWDNMNIPDPIQDSLLHRLAEFYEKYQLESLTLDEFLRRQSLIC